MAGGDAIGSLIGGVIGSIANDGDEDSQRSAYENALKGLQGVGVPSIEEQRIALAKYAQQGELTPEMLETITQGDTGLNNISTDPRLKDAQMRALQTLTEQSQGGLTATDRDALLKVNKGVERDAKGRNDSILLNMAQRGMSGSGAELAAQLANSQAAMDNAQSQGSSIAAQAQAKALQAALSSGQLGGSIRDQDYTQAAQAASAQDAINKFNTNNRQSVATTNVGARNNAQSQNLNAKQSLANSNVDITNKQEMYNKGLYQQQFDNAMRKAGGVAGQQNKNAAFYGDQANQTQQFWTGIGKGVGQVGEAVATGGASAAMPSGAGTEVGSTKNSMYANRYAHGGIVKPEEGHSLFGLLGKVSGEAEVPGDSEANDTVHAMLSPGEMVLPRTIADADDETILGFIKNVRRASKGK